MYFFVTLFHFVLFFFFRLLFLFLFKPETVTDEVYHSLLLGGKFDLRLAVFISLPLLILSMQRLAKKPLTKTLTIFYLMVVNFFVTCFYIFDFSYFSYLNTRINSSIFAFLTNINISLGMMWESYPVLSILFATLIFMTIYYFLINKVLVWSFKYWQPKWKLKVTVFILFVFMGYGKFAYFPLRWSEAFFSTNTFYNYLAVNPVLYFFETYKFSKEKPFDDEAVRKSKPLLAEFLQTEWPNSQDLPERKVIRKGNNSAIKNVIIIVMESMAFGKTSLSDNPINTTPNLKRIAEKSHYFSRYFSPHEGTARNMFGITTSVVDVTRFKTSSRNPLVVDQRVIANDFIGYDKFYFLGGSANWANIRAVFANNIKGLKVIEEKDHKSKRVDVWGISDLDLLKEAADRLVLEKKPFLATIQLAGFHRPYTIPEDRGDFRLLDKSVDYKRAGFNSIEQLNSIRFSDYALGEFFKKVKQSSLIENTLFVITGDHGIPDEGGVNISKAYHIHGLERYHVPLVLFAPKILEPKEDQRIASEIDIMPTVASLVGIEHKLTTLGRDLMETKYDKSRVAFIFDSYAPKVSYSLLSDEFYYKMRNKDKEELFLFKDGAEPGIDVKTQYPEVFKKLSSLAHAFYEANRYFLYKNKKPKLESGPK